MKIFIVGEISANNRNYNDEVNDEMCKALRYYYSDNHDEMDKSIAVISIDSFSPLSSLNLVQVALNHLNIADKVVLTPGYEFSKIGNIVKTIAEEYLNSKIVYPDTFRKITEEYRNRHMVVREEDANRVKKIFISQPLSGIPEEESTKQRLKAEDVLRKYYESKGEEVEFLHHTEELAPDDIKNKRIWYLGRSISILADADAIAFLPGWKKAPGCCIESEVALRYNIKVIPQWVLESMFVDDKYAAAFTVGELMNELKKYPADRPVCFNATIESKIDAQPLQFIVNQCNLMIPDKYLEENL